MSTNIESCYFSDDFKYYRFHSAANMFDKFAKQDEITSKPTKDVFQRAEEEAPDIERTNEEEMKENENSKAGAES